MIGGGPPALMSVLTFRPFAIVWLCWFDESPALTPVFTFSPRAIVWLWFGAGGGVDGGSGQGSLSPALTLVLTLSPFAAVWLCWAVQSPALTPLLTFKPRDIVWLCWNGILPALTLVLTFNPRAAVWLWFKPQIGTGQSPFLSAFTFVLTFTVVFLSLRLIAAIHAAYLYRRKGNAKLLAGERFFARIRPSLRFRWHLDGALIYEMDSSIWNRFLDRIEIRRVSGDAQDSCPSLFDQTFGPLRIMKLHVTLLSWISFGWRISESEVVELSAVFLPARKYFDSLGIAVEAPTIGAINAQRLCSRLDPARCAGIGCSYWRSTGNGA